MRIRVQSSCVRRYCDITIIITVLSSLVLRVLCEGGGKRAGYTLFVHAPNSFDNLHTTLLH